MSMLEGSDEVDCQSLWIVGSSFSNSVLIGFIKPFLKFPFYTFRNYKETKVLTLSDKVDLS